MTTHRSTNRLAQEKSPYLLQHQHNPVDWFPWGDEAFAKARAENKPVFLSIGYSTCHWCHVMERESFEDPTVARFLNAQFVSIKVDREERPDVDRIYMTFVQAMTGSGGWPLNVFLLPDRRPFYGGTYFPPRTRPGRPGFLDLLEQLAQVWKDRKGDVSRSAAEIHERLAAHVAREPLTGLALGPALLANAATRLKSEYDPQHGGFGGAPKFPRPSHPAFLLRWSQRAGDEEARRMVLYTCERMAAGGMCDQLGGGFARYSVDDAWLVPHFEKMLYDNAQLVQLYLDAYLVSRDPRHAATVHDIVRYVLRDLTHPDGGFFSAEDADSEGKEGRFYCWTRTELQTLLAPAEFGVATRYFGVTEQGNFLDHSDPDPLPGQNVLHVAQPALAPDEAALLESARVKMLAARAQRVRPHLDDKVLASWNGLMLGALARAAVVLDEPAYLAAARRNLAFLQQKLWDAPSRTLYHRWRDGARDSVQLLEAYAFLLSGTLDLYSATLEPDHLDFARQLAEAMIARFYDPAHGGFWQAPTDSPDLILQVKEDYDGAEPSGNSVAVLGLLKLADITGRLEFREPAEQTLRLFAARLNDLPQAVPHLLSGLDYWVGETRRVVIAAGEDREGIDPLVRAAHQTYAPNQVVMGTTGSVEAFASGLPAAHGHATAYVCTGNTCLPPLQDAEALARILAKPD
ncbi:MAG: thioredoxin domain-containing protein [Verrucomicrobiales bacterium]|nr:thioredoxin domain-containing protein [Verrucomicrobiales bacterium]